VSNEDNLPVDERPPFERFRDLAKRVFNVPPEDLKRRQEEWTANRKKGRKKNGPGAKPGPRSP
jgi:hypothetical protein